MALCMVSIQERVIMGHISYLLRSFLDARAEIVTTNLVVFWSTR